MKYLCSLILILLSLPCVVQGADLYGLVWAGSSGTPASGARVSVKCSGNGSGAGTVDSHAHYRVSGLRPNSVCQLTISFDGKNSRPINVPLDGPTTNANLLLRPVGRYWLIERR